MADGTAVARPRRKAKRPGSEPLPTTTDGLEIALEAEVSDPRPDSPARRLLVQHERLLRWQVASETASFGLKILTGLACAAAAGVLAWMAWSASQTNTLIVEPFRTPQDFAARGLDGVTVANQVLDRLSAMQAGTDSSRAASSFQNNWDDGIKVAIPNTGLSLDDVNRLLRGWLGRETHISGEVFRTPSGLTITARVGDTSAEPFSGSEAELDALISRAAESIYRQTQPYRYAMWLGSHGRAVEVRPYLAALAETGPPDDRPFALTGLANRLYGDGDAWGAGAIVREAIDKYPDFIKAYWNLSDVQLALGHDEALLATRRHILRDGSKDKRLTPISRLHVRYSSQIEIASLTGDYAAAARDSALEKVLPEWGGNSAGAASREMLALLAAHEVAASRRLAARSLALARDPAERANFALHLALETGDLGGVDRQGFGHAPSAETTWYPRVETWPYEALFLARAGDIAAAQALIGRTPTDCYACVRARGQIAARAGDRAAAERWFGEAIRQGPSLPQAYSDFGRARLTWGDRQGAIALFEQAVKRGPRFADPLASWGDALLADGDARGAAAKYKAAARLAPRWGRLQLKWGEALAALGKGQAAAAHWRIATGLALSPEERAQVTRRLATPGA